MILKLFIQKLLFVPIGATFALFECTLSQLKVRYLPFFIICRTFFVPLLRICFNSVREGNYFRYAFFFFSFVIDLHFQFQPS